MLLLHRFIVNISCRYIGLIVAAIVLSGCSSAPQQTQRASSALRDTYCDSYLVYDMCVRDIDADGKADLMYFEDTEEVFMVTNELMHANTKNLNLHRCVQTMDSATREASTRLLDINEHTGLMKKTQLKSKLMLVYMHYYNDIQSCMNGHTVADRSDTSDTFGDDEQWSDGEFGEL